MYHQLATRAVVTDAAEATSRAVSLDGGNAAYVSMEATTFGPTALQVIADVGNDLQNWSPAGTLTLDAVGFKSTTFGGLATAFVRLRYRVSVGTGTVVLSGGLDTRRL